MQVYENVTSKQSFTFYAMNRQGSFEKVWDKLSENVKQVEQQHKTMLSIADSLTPLEELSLACSWAKGFPLKS